MHAKYESKMMHLKEEHHNEIQKYQISQVMNDFSKRYQFEDKISDQEMLMKQLNEQNSNKESQIAKLEEQLSRERSQQIEREKVLAEELKQVNHKNERMQLEVTDLEFKLTQV